MRTLNETPGLAQDRAPARSKPSSDLSSFSTSLQIVSSAVTAVVSAVPEIQIHIS